MSDAVDKIRRWGDLVPDSEMDMPLFVVERRGGQAAITPRQAQERVQRPASVIGRAFRATYTDLPIPVLDLVLLRARRKLLMTPVEERDKPVIGNYSGLMVSMTGIVDHLERDTDTGKQLRKIYEGYIAWLMKRYRGA